MTPLPSEAGCADRTAGYWPVSMVARFTVRASLFASRGIPRCRVPSAVPAGRGFGVRRALAAAGPGRGTRVSQSMIRWPTPRVHEGLAVGAPDRHLVFGPEPAEVGAGGLRPVAEPASNRGDRHADRDGILGGRGSAPRRWPYSVATSSQTHAGSGPPMDCGRRIRPRPGPAAEPRLWPGRSCARRDWMLPRMLDSG
jgi:hypothetical protein